MKLSIVIVSYNAKRDLERCLDSLLAGGSTATHEIVVVDNGSTDGSVADIGRWPAVRAIENGANLGFARASNIGIRASSGENVLLLNNDTIVPAGALDRLIAILESRPDVAVVGPRLVDANGRAELSFGRMIGPFTEFRQKRLSRSGLVDQLTRREQSPAWVSGACLLVRRRDAEAVGLLDERFFMYTEDVDFCASIRARGRGILFTPDVEIVHFRGRSGSAAPRTTADAYRQSRIAFYEKHHPAWVPVLKVYLWIRGV